MSRQKGTCSPPTVSTKAPQYSSSSATNANIHEPSVANAAEISNILGQTRNVLYMQQQTGPPDMHIGTLNDRRVQNGQYIVNSAHSHVASHSTAQHSQQTEQIEQQQTEIGPDQPAINEFGGIPYWLSTMFQNLNLRLQHIETQLVSQNRNWQQVEATLLEQKSEIQTQNTRMSNIEHKLSDLNNMKQNVNHLQNSLRLLTEKVNVTNERMSEYDVSIQTYSDLCDEIRSDKSQSDMSLNELYKTVETLQNENERLRKGQAETESTLIDLQCRSMRDNLIFTGINEPELSAEEYENTEETLCYFLRNEMNISEQIPFDRVHRIGPYQPNKDYPRHIVAKFEKFKDREKVRRAAPETLKGKPFGVREQFPKSIEDRRKLLYPELKKAKRDPRNKVRLIRDKLYINNSEFIPTEPENDYEYDTGRKQKFSHSQRQRIFTRSKQSQHPTQTDEYVKRRQSVYQRSANWRHSPVQIPKEQQRVVGFEIPTTNKFEVLSHPDINSDTVVNLLSDKRTNPKSGKHSASSPLDQDKTIKRQREFSGSAQQESDIEIEDIDMSPQCDPPLYKDNDNLILAPKPIIDLSVPPELPSKDSATLNEGPVVKVSVPNGMPGENATNIA